MPLVLNEVFPEWMSCTRPASPLTQLLYEAVKIAIVIAWQHEAVDNGSANVGHRPVATARSTIVELLADPLTALALEDGLWVATAHGQVAVLFFLQCLWWCTHIAIIIWQYMAKGVNTIYNILYAILFLDCIQLIGQKWSPNK